MLLEPYRGFKQLVSQGQNIGLRNKLLETYIELVFIVHK